MSTSQIEKLPIYPFLDEICENLKKSDSRFLVLTAETAAGKSTAVPLALLKHFQGKILMLEPRRLAVTAIADRVADLLGEETGKTAGYRLHLESKVSSSTRFEVITEGILTRRLQKDPSLSDINVVVLDEFHERSIHGDLALAFLKEAMALRDDLFIIVMSATIDHKSLSEYLNAPVMKIPGRQFPVEIIYEENEPVSSIIKCFRDGFEKETDSILVFLPGIYEINKAHSELKEYFSPEEAEILILHSSIPLKDQRKVLSPREKNSPPRIILSSAIAETSLTVPDVTIVIDSGLSRVNRTDISLGMEKLVTEKESIFSADQRAGRAGRVRKGKCIRLWNRNEVRPERNTPEILRVDLTQLVLECAKWGCYAPEDLDWLDSPSKAAWDSSKKLLEELKCLKNGKITEKGNAVLTFGLHPRLGSVAFCGEKAFSTVLKFSEFKDANSQRQKIFLEDLKRRIERCGKTADSEKENGRNANFILEGFPDRIARLCEKNLDSSIYQFPSGRKAVLNKINGSEWIVAPEVNAGEKIGKIHSYEELNSEKALSWLEERAEIFSKAEFQSEGNLKLAKYEYKAYGEIVLKKTKLSPNPEDFKEAVCNSVKEKGIGWLPTDEKIENLMIRAEFFGLQKKPELLEKLQNLQFTSEEWLAPFISSNNLNPQTVFDGLFWFLGGDEIDQNAPMQIILPNGKKRKILYEKQNGTIRPVLEIIIQQIFGCFETPKVLGVPVLLKLLSPARRPLQITEDLEHFWNGAWIEICKEMKGRYPKHNWDFRITEKD